jgi:DNA-binding NarL/FixJ family response regulator
MAGERVRILIADDHAVVRKGLALVLQLEPDFEVVGEAGDGRQAIELAHSLKPDMVLLDLVMPNLDGKATALRLQEEMPEIKILILTGTEFEEGVLDLIATGVDGYVLKDIEPAALKRAIRAIANGEAYLYPSVARRVLDRMAAGPPDPPPSPLTPREMEVLEWMATSRTYREIAEALFIGEETVRSHAKNILSKLNQPNRAQAVLAAVRLELIDLPAA